MPYLFAYGPARLQETLVELGNQLLDIDAGRSAMADVLAALVSFSCCRMDEVPALCHRVLSSAESAGPMHDLALMLSVVAQALGGELTGSLRHLLEYARKIHESPTQVETSSVVLLATTLAWTGAWSMSSRPISKLVRQCHERGEVFNLAHLLAVRSDLGFRAGNWAAALGDSAKSEELARETGQLTVTSYALIMRARVEGGLGRSEEASRHVADAFNIASELGLFLEAANSAVGFVALAAGRIPQAIDALEQARNVAEQEGLTLITAFPWLPDLVEAYLRAGCPDKAQEVVGWLERSPVEGDLPLALQARCKALVADADYGELFLESVQGCAAASAPFETARSHLAYGERLRRDGRRKDAIGQFERAHEYFVRLQALPWLDRTERELAACGRVRTPTDSTFTDLTIQELQVAVTVAGGVTSREAAAALILSPRTVEYHLQQVYRKLGIRSRAELVRRLGNAYDPGQLDPG